jgi:hypothetical protein
VCGWRGGVLGLEGLRVEICGGVLEWSLLRFDLSVVMLRRSLLLID